MSIANLHERDRRGIPREIKQKEMVDHPTHYKPEGSKYEAIDVIEDWDLGFNDGNAVKAIWYLKRHLENIKKETE